MNYIYCYSVLLPQYEKERRRRKKKEKQMFKSQRMTGSDREEREGDGWRAYSMIKWNSVV